MSSKLYIFLILQYSYNNQMRGSKDLCRNYVEYHNHSSSLELLLVLDPIAGSFYAGCHLDTSGPAQLDASSMHRTHCHDQKQTQNQN